MPSLRNRKVKVKIRGGVISVSLPALPKLIIDEVSDFKKRFDIFISAVQAIKWFPRPTIDEYVNGKCFGCGAKTTITTGKEPDVLVDLTFSTDGKYCSDSCNPLSHVVTVEIYNYETECFELACGA